jgi:amino acid transporter
MIGFWLAGGVLSLIGALCLAELSTMHRDEVGGDYVYLRNAFGRPVAFMFAWASFWIVRPGNIAAMAMVFATYFDELVSIPELPIPGGNLIPVALLAVGLLSVLNLVGLKAGKRAQNILTLAKVIGIGGVVLVAFWWGGSPGSESTVTDSPKFGSIWLGMVFVMFTYGGWNDIVLVAGEVQQPKKNLFRSLVLGTLAVTLIYVLVNLAFVHVLGFSAMSQSTAVATDTVSHTFGEESWWGRSSGALIAGLVCVSCLGAINAMILTGPRIYYAAGRDFPPLAFLSRWSEQRAVPWQGMLCQGAITTGLILLCLGNGDAFHMIVIVVTPYFWGFLGLVAISLMVLRIRGWREGRVESGLFKVPFFPLEPIILLVICGALAVASTNYLISQGYWTTTIIVGVIMGIGVVAGVVLSIKYEESRLG